MRRCGLGERLLAGTCRILVVLLVPAMMVTPEMRAQEAATTEGNGVVATKPVVEVLFVVPQPIVIHQGTSAIITVRLRVNNEVRLADTESDAALVLTKALTLDNGIVLNGEPSLLKADGGKEIQPVVPTVVTPGEWNLTFSISARRLAVKGPHQVSGELAFLDSTPTDLLSPARSKLDVPFAVVGPYHDYRKWNLLWQIPLYAPVIALISPLLLVFLVTCYSNSNECV